MADFYKNGHVTTLHRLTRTAPNDSKPEWIDLLVRLIRATGFDFVAPYCQRGILVRETEAFSAGEVEVRVEDVSLTFESRKPGNH